MDDNEITTVDGNNQLILWKALKIIEDDNVDRETKLLIGEMERKSCAAIFLLNHLSVHLPCHSVYLA